MNLVEGNANGKRVAYDFLGRRLDLDQVFDVDLLGGTVWRGATLLSNYLLHRFGENGMRGMRCVDLGSGIGLSGMAACMLGAHTVFTDTSDVVPLLKKNIVNNHPVLAGGGGQWQVEEYEWGTLKGHRLVKLCPHIVMMSEVLYDPELVAPLFHSLLHLATANTEVILTNDTRAGPAAADFLKLATKYFSVDRISVSELEEFAPSWVPPKSQEEGVFLLKRNNITDYRTSFCK
jgi:predicted nicotinamide N-methyase